MTARELNKLGCTISFDALAKRDYKPDIVHFFGMSVPLWVSRSASKFPTVVSTIHLSWGLKEAVKRKVLSRTPGGSWRSVRKALLQCQALLPNSQAELESVSRTLGIAKNRMIVIPNGVEPEMIGSSPESFRRNYGIFPNHDKFILSVHRIEKRKNTLRLIEAALNLKVPLLLRATPNLFPREKEYVRRVMELALKNSHLIRIIEPLPREILADAYAAAHVHALPSVFETTGLASLEAGINGANLVVGDCPPVREYFDGIADFCTQKKGSLEEALSKALSRPRNGLYQKEYILAHYTWDKVAELTKQVYEKILSKW